MENQISLKENWVYSALIFMSWLLLCMCIITYSFPSNIVPYSFKYIIIFTSAGILTILHLMISIFFVEVFKRIFQLTNLKAKTITIVNKIGLRFITDNVPNTLNLNTKKENQISMFDYELQKSGSFGDFLIDGLWNKILAHENGVKIFNKNERIHAERILEINYDNTITKAIIISSLMDACTENNLFKKKYIIKEQKKIAQKYFNIDYSVGRDKYRNSFIFDWLATLK